eukprot:UN05845
MYMVTLVSINIIMFYLKFTIWSVVYKRIALLIGYLIIFFK